jgi:general nucleoside transport system permease protein
MIALRRVGLALLAPLIAVAAAMVVTSLVVQLSGSPATDFWNVIFSRPENRLLVNIANQSSLIYLAALAAAIGFRMNLFNIGVEGQYTLASYSAATFAGAALLPGPLNVLAACLLAVVVGAAWAGIAGVLKVTRGVSEVISTIMLNAIAISLAGYLLNRYGVHAGNGVGTRGIPKSSQVGGYTPFTAADGQLWSLGLLAVLAGFGFWFLVNRTRFGFNLRATGMSPSAAVASGVNVNRMVIYSMLLSGGIAGIIWMPAFFGDAHSYGVTFQAGLGFTGIAVALLGRNQPLGIVFGAVLFAFLNEQSNRLTLETDVSPDIVSITQGIIVLAVVIAYELVRRIRTRTEQNSVANAPSTRAPGEVVAA